LALAISSNAAAFNDKPTEPPSPLNFNPKPTAIMPGVSVKDIESHKFVAAYAAFLKRQGKLPM